MRKWLPIILISALFVCFQFGVPALPFRAVSPPSVIAHRGDSAHAPENTMIAFRLALQSGADGIELDVRKTKDQVPLVFHDDNFRRIFRANYLVDELTADELWKLTGNPDSSQNRSASSVCTLEEVLLLCCAHPETSLHIELKVPDAEEKVVSLIKKYDLSGQCEISSGDPAVLQKINNLNPEIRTVLLISSIGDLLAYKYGDIIYLFQSADVRSSAMHADGISVRASLITASLVRSAHRRNQYIYAWTVNSDFEIRRMCQLGVDGIITDDPSYAARRIYSDH